MLTITVDDSAFAATLRQLQARLSDLTPVMEGIGYAIETRVRSRFETRTDPDGRPWSPWAESTREAYPFAGTEAAKAEGPGNARLLDRYGTMLAGLNYQAGPSSVRIGFAMPYSTYHEFGTRHMPRRGMLMSNPETGQLAPEDERTILDLLTQFLGDVPPV